MSNGIAVFHALVSTYEDGDSREYRGKALQHLCNDPAKYSINTTLTITTRIQWWFCWWECSKIKRHIFCGDSAVATIRKRVSWSDNGPLLSWQPLTNMDRFTKSQTEEVVAEAKYLPMRLSHHVLKAAASEGASLASRAKFACFSASGQLRSTSNQHRS